MGLPYGSVGRRKVSDWKVAASWFDSQTGMCRWEKTLYAYFPLGQAVYPLWRSNLTIDWQPGLKKVLCVCVVRQAQSDWFIRLNE